MKIKNSLQDGEASPQGLPHRAPQGSRLRDQQDQPPVQGPPGLKRAYARRARGSHPSDAAVMKASRRIASARGSRARRRVLVLRRIGLWRIVGTVLCCSHVGARAVRSGLGGDRGGSGPAAVPIRCRGAEVGRRGSRAPGGRCRDGGVRGLPDRGRRQRRPVRLPVCSLAAGDPRRGRRFLRPERHSGHPLAALGAAVRTSRRSRRSSRPSDAARLPRCARAGIRSTALSGRQSQGTCSRHLISSCRGRRETLVLGSDAGSAPRPRAGRGNERRVRPGWPDGGGDGRRGRALRPERLRRVQRRSRHRHQYLPVRVRVRSPWPAAGRAGGSVLDCPSRFSDRPSGRRGAHDQARSRASEAPHPLADA